MQPLTTILKALKPTPETFDKLFEQAVIEVKTNFIITGQKDKCNELTLNEDKLKEELRTLLKM